MTRALERRIAAVKQALLAGDPASALARLDDLVETLGRSGIDAPTRALLEPALAELRVLAEASLSGARQAAEELRDMVVTARSLQTYDRGGRRHVTATIAPVPQRY